MMYFLEIRIYDVLKVKRGDQVEIETEKDVVEIIEVDKYRHAERHSNGSLAINTETDGEIRRIFKICPEQ